MSREAFDNASKSERITLTRMRWEEDYSDYGISGYRPEGEISISLSEGDIFAIERKDNASFIHLHRNSRLTEIFGKKLIVQETINEINKALLKAPIPS